MGYRNVYYDAREECVHLWTWDDNGNRIKIKNSFEPYVYIESTSGVDAVSIFNTPLKKLKFKNQFERSKFLNETTIKRIFYNLNCEQQYLLDTYKNISENEDFSKNKLKIFYFDIETYGKNGFASPKDATDPINLITVYDSLSKKYYTWGLKNDFSVKGPDQTYIKCKTEESLLKKFLEFWSSDYPDCITGWNISGYDIPYIINRISIILGEEESKKLSPVQKLHFRENVAVNKLGKAIDRWHIYGLSILDYMEVYKTFTLGDRESYSLNYISEYELGENKIQYVNSSLADLADNDWNTFVEYNIQDVKLLIKLEEKLKYLKLIRNLSYKGFIPFEKAMGKVSLITGAVAHQALKENKIIPTFNIQNTKQNFAGGFVLEPKPGLYEDVVTYDANSLYPNTIITLNISTETKIGKIINIQDNKYTIKLTNEKIVKLEKEKFEKLVVKEKLSITKANVLYTQKFKGIVPNLIDKLYSERISAKNKMLDAKKKIKKAKTQEEKNILKEEIVDNDTLSNVYKVILNSIYGVFSQVYSPLFDIDHAESVTLSGQAVVKEGSQIIYEYAKSIGFEGEEKDICIYQDTDSEFFSFKNIFKIKNIILKKDDEITKEAFDLIEEFGEVLNEKINKWAEKEFNSIDSRYFFKREKICDVALLQKKKFYILHILDKEGVKTNSFEYKGIEVAKSILSKEVKNLIKGTIETALISKDKKIASKTFQEGYEKFCQMSPEQISLRKKINNLEKYLLLVDSNGNFSKGTPNHVKAVIRHNRLIEKLKINDVYQKISSGEKIKLFYCLKNSLGYDNIAFSNNYPKEFQSHIKPDYKTMFEKNISPVIARVFTTIGWPIPIIGCEQVTDLTELFT